MSFVDIEGTWKDKHQLIGFKPSTGDYVPVEGLNVAGMLAPVQCAHCYRPYDLGNVQFLAIHDNGAVFRTPCCNRRIDDRVPGCADAGVKYYRLDHEGQREGVQ